MSADLSCAHLDYLGSAHSLVRVLRNGGRELSAFSKSNALLHLPHQQTSQLRIPTHLVCLQPRQRSRQRLKALGKTTHAHTHTPTHIPVVLPARLFLQILRGGWWWRLPRSKTRASHNAVVLPKKTPPHPHPRPHLLGGVRQGMPRHTIIMM